MMRRGGLGLALVSLIAAAAAGAAPVTPVRPLRVDRVTLGVQHRVFGDFAEVDTVRMKQDFQIGDTRFSARVVEFVPDFFLDVKQRRVSSRSNEPKNPAFRVVIRERGVPRDTTWAFLNAMPHFTRNSLLAFRVLRIDFVDRPPLLPDTSRRTSAMPGAAGEPGHP